ncbi:MAG TPA: hypothetical protein VH231_20270 [Solirubrobacteraceae bacterium]|nr:hypothetical protein [Solirubrobacteraceae bacterium]
MDERSPSARAHRTGTLILSSAMILIGIALVVTAIVVGASIASGRIILGVLFVAAGGARLYLLARS